LPESQNPNWGVNHNKKEMTYPAPGSPIVYTDVNSRERVTIRDYKLVRVTYNTLFTRTQPSQKEKAEKRANKNKAGKKASGTKRHKRTWLTDYVVLVREGMVKAAQGRISENNDVNLVQIKFVKRATFPEDAPRIF